MQLEWRYLTMLMAQNLIGLNSVLMCFFLVVPWGGFYRVKKRKTSRFLLTPPPPIRKFRCNSFPLKEEIIYGESTTVIFY